MRVLLSSLLSALFLMISLSSSSPVLLLPTVNAQTPTTETTTVVGDKIIPSSDTPTTYVDDTGLTFNYVPPGWSIIDYDNTSPEAARTDIELKYSYVADLCPPHSKAETDGCTDPGHGSINVWYIPHMDQNERIAPLATERDPETGLLELNLTAQNVLDYTKYPDDLIVQNKTVPINVTNPQDGTSWQVQGMQVLLTDPLILTLGKVGLYFVDYNTGFEITVSGPSGDPETEGIDREMIELFRFMPDPRGDPIPIHGIGLDNLPAVMNEPMQIINSVSITRR